MIKLVVICALFLCSNTSAQRPPFAGKTNRYDGVLPQYETQQNVANVGAAASVASRIDTVGSDASVTTQSTVDLPVDALGDVDLVNRIKTWPRDKQPFWYINWQQIQAHRGDTKTLGQTTQPPRTDTRFSSTY